MPHDLMASFADFITASPSSYHAAAEVAARLRGAGFAEQDETLAFDPAPGGHFFVRDGAVMAWRLAADATAAQGFRVVGSHTDSPSFVLKPNPGHESAGWQQAGMEVYGGPLLNSWLNRDLGLAGRLTTLDGDSHLVATGPLMVIPQLAPHLDRSVNENLHLDKQQHLMPVFASGRADFDVVAHLCEVAGIAREELAYYDVHATDTQPPALVGDAMFAAWRMDNLSSVFASLEAFLALEDGEGTAVLAAFDHEEVGSSTRSGACGPILEDTLRRVALSLGVDAEGFHRMVARSSCVSADAGHAVHPNYVDMHDPENRPLFNAGPLLKINGNQRYATDAKGAALWLRACRAADVPTQSFVSNNAVPCGSTIGPLTATRLGLLTVDVGIPLLSMHSARELCGVDDVGYLSRALGAYWAGA